MLFNGPEYKAQKRLQEQVRDHLKASGHMPYYATYNLLDPGDEETFRKHKVDEKIREFFRKGEVGDNVGNEAIACRLEERLVEHLEQQLPRMFKVFTGTLKKLDKKLEKTNQPMEPSWNAVEHISLIYARLVQNYIKQPRASIGAVQGRGLYDRSPLSSDPKIWPTEQVLNIMGYDDDYADQPLMYNLVAEITQQLGDLLLPANLYMDSLAADSLLHWPTAHVLKQAKIAKGADGEGFQALEEYKVAKVLGEALFRTLAGQIPAAAERMKRALVGLESSNGLCQEFYRSVAKVEFRDDV
eukprot:COSAG02_NODE_6241_length_3705_cov_183.110094_2_plen_299_part_00